MILSMSFSKVQITVMGTLDIVYSSAPQKYIFPFLASQIMADTGVKPNTVDKSNCYGSISIQTNEPQRNIPK